VRNHFSPAPRRPIMDRQRIVALVLVGLMLFSSLAYAIASL
jgi:hypothetical protein